MEATANRSGNNAAQLDRRSSYEPEAQIYKDARRARCYMAKKRNEARADVEEKEEPEVEVEPEVEPLLGGPDMAAFEICAACHVITGQKDLDRCPNGHVLCRRCSQHFAARAGPGCVLCRVQSRPSSTVTSRDSNDSLNSIYIDSSRRPMSSPARQHSWHQFIQQQQQQQQQEQEQKQQNHYQHQQQDHQYYHHQQQQDHYQQQDHQYRHHHQPQHHHKQQQQPRNHYQQQDHQRQQQEQQQPSQIYQQQQKQDHHYQKQEQNPQQQQQPKNHYQQEIPNEEYQGGQVGTMADRLRPDAALNRPEASLNRSEATLNRSEATLNRSDAALNPPGVALNRPDAALTRPEVALNRPEAALNRPDAALTRPEAALNRPEVALNRPEATFNRLEGQRSARRELSVPRLDRSQTQSETRIHGVQECSRRPIRCPRIDCAMNVAFSALTHHFLFDHPEVPVVNVDPGTRSTMIVGFGALDLDTSRCLALLLVSGKALEPVAKLLNGNQPNPKYRNRLPLPVLAARLSQPDYRSMNAGNGNAGQTTSNSLIIVWVAGLDFGNTAERLRCSIQAVDSIDGEELRSLTYTGPVNSLRSGQCPTDVLSSGDCIVLHEGLVDRIAHNSDLIVNVVVH